MRVLRVTAPFVLHALAREVDAATGVLLHTTLDLPSFLPQALSLIDLPGAAMRVVAWAAVGLALSWTMARLRVWTLGELPAEAAVRQAGSFDALLLRPALTVIALFSLALRATYPYGFTLPVALTQDWGVAQDAAALAAVLASHHWLFARLPRIPAPRATGVAFLAFLAYSLLTPDWARRWEGHPGNEPKTLRMALALGHSWSLDVEGVYAAMEAVPVEPLAVAAPRAAVTLARESVRMLRALAEGPRAVGAPAIRATRLTRQTIRGKEGGVFHVLAPGPSLLLAPVLRLDRWLNLRRGTPGRLAVSLLAWNALAAATVAAVFLLLRDATGRDGLAAFLSGVVGLLPPYVFYSYQFYPEMLGALALAVALRAILFGRFARMRSLLALGLLLATLPWLHQKFLPVWGVLTAMAVARAVGELVTFRQLLALFVPQVISAGLVALYNFAITGSVRPDALFLAWGPAGVTSSRIGQGVLGLLLDARYGLLPYVPVYLLAAGGLLGAGRPARALRLGSLAAGVYYLTVAAADNWSGAVCNLGRYVMPATPWAAALVARALAGATPAVTALALALGAWSALIGGQLWADPHAANDCAVLLSRSSFADGNVYVPNLMIRTWADGAPGLGVRVMAWIVGIALLGFALRWMTSRRAASPARAIAGVAAFVLTAGLVLERWPSPSPRRAARFEDALEIAPGVTAFVHGARLEGGAAWLRDGRSDMWLRARQDVAAVRLLAEGMGALRVPGHPPLTIGAAGLVADVPLETLRRLQGRRGAVEVFSRVTIDVETAGEVRLRLALPAP